MIHKPVYICNHSQQTGIKEHLFSSLTFLYQLKKEFLVRGLPSQGIEAHLLPVCPILNTTQSNLQIQCNHYQTTTGIFHRTRTKNFTICMETQKTLNSQSNLEKEKRSWRNQAP